MNETREWLGTADVARWLDIDPRTVRRLVDDKELAARRVGRRRSRAGRRGVLRFRPEDVTAYLERIATK